MLSIGFQLLESINGLKIELKSVQGIDLDNVEGKA